MQNTSIIKIQFLNLSFIYLWKYPFIFTNVAYEKRQVGRYNWYKGGFSSTTKPEEWERRSMSIEDSQPDRHNLKPYRRLKLSLFEQVMIVGMLVVILLTTLDALDGSQVGKTNALSIAKMQGQQELMAARLK